MRDIHVDFTTQIREHGLAGERDLSAEDIASLDRSLNVLLDLDPATLRLGFALGAGRFGSLGQALDLLYPPARRIAA